MVQTAQWHRQHNGTDSTMVQTIYRSWQQVVHMIFVCVVSAEGQSLHLEHDIQGVWILYFHCYNGATILQLGLVHLKGTDSLLGTLNTHPYRLPTLDW